MREIKFRGKGVDNGDWVYGSLVIPNTGSRDVYIFNNAGVEFTGSLAEWEVIPETVGQFTGLKDKEGNDIYEGDIVKMHRFTQVLGENLGVREGEIETTVTISIGVMGVMVDKEPLFSYFDEDFDDMSEPFEVIGNIHDNPTT